MKILEWGKVGVLFSTFLIFVGLGAFLKQISSQTVLSRQCDCSTAQQEAGMTHGSSEPLAGPGGLRSASVGPEPRYLSYQPPGNGWNNQRIALENALVLAKLLNRTLLVHPLAPHALGTQLKAGHRPGYVAYNMLKTADLLQPAYFLDLQRMAQLVPVIAVNSSHPQFVHEYSNLTWKNVCHSTGFGYWVDQPPAKASEVELLSEQKFTPIKIWKDKCPEEQKRAEQDPSTPIVRYVSDLEREPSQMLYFEQGTLFAIHIRFTILEKALEAQKWVLEYVQYSPRVWRSARAIARAMGPFNAIQVRRKDHIDKKLTASYWLDRMLALNFSTSLPLYVATDHYDEEWFRPFHSQGFRIFVAQDFSEILDFSFLPKSLQSDYLGIHEQCICELAVQFVPSPASTFAALILRRRGEVEKRDGLMVDTLHTFWIGHQTKHHAA
jgi:hypothetical protein